MHNWDDDDEIEFEMIEDEYGEEAWDRKKANAKKVREAGRASQPVQSDISGSGCLTGIIMMAAVVTLLIIFPG